MQRGRSTVKQGQVRAASKHHWQPNKFASSAKDQARLRPPTGATASGQSAARTPSTASSASSEQQKAPSPPAGTAPGKLNNTNIGKPISKTASKARGTIQLGSRSAAKPPLSAAERNRAVRASVAAKSRVLADQAFASNSKLKNTITKKTASKYKAAYPNYEEMEQINSCRDFPPNTREMTLNHFVDWHQKKLDKGRYTVVFDKLEAEGQLKGYLNSHLRNSNIVDFHVEKLRVYIGEKTLADALEVLRVKMVKCMRTGQPFVINL